MAPPADNPRRRSRARSWPTSSACPRPRPRPTRPRRQSCRPGAAPCPRPRGWPSRPMPIDRRLLFNIDWGMMAAVLLLLGIGVATILSATYSGRSSGLEVKQVYWILIGLVALLVCVSIDYRRLVDHAPLLYLASVAVLAYVLFLGPRGAGYQKMQSEIAVGSGGLAGRGYKQGTQAQLGYLPARHTDFIFSVLAEENGFVGVVVVLGLYLFILWRAMDTAQMARDRVGAFLAAGVAAVLAFQVGYNVGMVAGLVPVKGLPLPLMSYGGSSIISSLLAVGLILNVRMRRFAN